jgi:PadR family transcriptional regulator, regulatory protein PadR
MILLSRSEEIVLVAIWKLADDAYGVTIRDRVSADTGHDWSFGAIYKPLKQLAHRGYVEKISGDPSPERGGRSKFYYRLTSDGQEALREIRRVHQAVWTKAVETAFK